MTRSQVSLRPAEVADALFLAELWADSLRRTDLQEQVADLEVVIKSAADSPEQRLLVAEHDGEPAGAVYLRVATVSPINLEPVVQALSPHVLPAYRRRGIGRTLMESAVAYAEELGVAHVMTAADSGSRDANRFMARLALAPQATVRVAATALVRSKIEAQRPGAGRGLTSRQRGQVLAARRSLRRKESQAEA
ncbi:GNAT family N-acetyltransferase [Nocardioides sp. Leaf307]|uniref:GNAT family N-acetyltransferase n=1 Tax=Nocardioides sp. Leaf307 TaxID=1736331 RepID=UPI000703AF8F|nr:GNAT family N-acetyltransferase [Nocardioides sp. Leaf307]KQQ41504.1 GNAT family acetyltransferase [Nocardioides sp. Leaf307]